MEDRWYVDVLNYTYECADHFSTLCRHIIAANYFAVNESHFHKGCVSESNGFGFIGLPDPYSYSEYGS